MKKIFIVSLALVLLFSLCACNNTSSNEMTNEEQQFAGTWISDEKGGDLYSFRLLSQGKAIWVKYWDSSSEGVLVTDEDDVHGGEWLVDENRIIIFYNATGWGEAYILDIANDNTLTWSGHTFSKVE